MEGDRGRSPVQNPDRRLAKNILGVIPSTPPKGASGGSRARQSGEGHSAALPRPQTLAGGFAQLDEGITRRMLVGFPMIPLNATSGHVKGRCYPP